MHHTRHSGNSSPLEFDPEIEKTARQNRALHRGKQIEQSTFSMEDPVTTSEPIEQGTFIPTSTHPSPNTTFTSEPPPPISNSQTPPNSTNLDPPIQQFPRFDNPPPQNNQYSSISHNLPFPQHTSTQNPPMPSIPRFEDFKVNHSGSSFYEAADTQKPLFQHSSPYVRIIPDDTPIDQSNSQQLPPPLNRNLPFQQSLPLQTLPTFTQRMNMGDDEDEYGEFENIGENRLNQQFARAQNRNGQGFFQQQQGNVPLRPNPRNLVRQVHPAGIPRQFERGPVRGVESHFKPAIVNNPSAVVIPQVHGRSFEVRSQAIQSLPKYHGLATEEPYVHLGAYDARCNTIGGQGFSPDDVKLVLFQFTLEDKAQQWFQALPSASIRTWRELQQQFLDEFYTTQRTNEARKNIRGFCQQSGELFHEAFTRFKMLLNNCPHHDIQLWELINSFAEGLTSEDARDLDSISNGTFGTNEEWVDWDYLERRAVTSKRKAQSQRRSKHPTLKAVSEVNMGDSDRLARIEQQLANLGTLGQQMCGHCGDLGHIADQCPMIVGMVEEVNQLQSDGRNFNQPRFNNFSYGNGNNQNGGQRSFNQSRFSNNFQGGSSGFSNANGNNEVMEMLKAMQSQMQKLNQRDEARNHKDAILDKSIQTLTTQVGQLAKDVADLKKNSGRLPSDTILNPSHQGSSSRNIHINAVSVVDAGRDSDCGRPLIPIQIGEYMTNKALLDYGSCISILPGSVYDQFDFGPLEEVSTTVVLADRSCKRPRGILRGVAVRVGDFYYPEDFIVLDYASYATEEQPTLILGRSFLATANVQINCRDNVVCMSFGNRKLNLSILSNSFTYFSDICSSAGTTNQCQPHVNEVDTKTKASMVDRSQVGVAEEEVKKEDEMKSNKAKPSVKQKATNSKKKSSKQEKSAELKKGDGIGDEEKAARKEAINSQSWRKKEDNRPNGKVFEGEFSFQPP